MSFKTLHVIAAVVLLAGCGDDGGEVPESPGVGIDAFEEGATERLTFHQIDIEVKTPISAGRIMIYKLLNGNVTFLESRDFDNPDPIVHLGYGAAIRTDWSAVLLHVITHGRTDSTPNEFVCAVGLDHSTSRHSSKTRCDLSSTVAYYFSASKVGRSGMHPFHDIVDRYPLWKAITEAEGSDLTGFYVSIFGTLQNALVGMGSNRFDKTRLSIRPVMETIVAQFIDEYQRKGSVSAGGLVEIANEVTDDSLPLARLTRYQAVFEEYAHVEDVQLDNTGGSLTRRSNELELLNMSNELRRFFLRGFPFEMSDYRTHVVQNVRHTKSDTETFVDWDPIGHMYGYNMYFNGEHVAYSRVPGLTLPADALGRVTIKAVGYAGEFDGIHHDLSGPTLIAGSEVQ